MTTVVRSALLLSITGLVAPLLAEAEPSADSGALEEVVVTAQRREENLQAVPIAATVANADALAAARVDNISDISAISPSIHFVTTNEPAAASRLQIRGLGTAGNNRSFEGSAGVFVDGVYRSRVGQLLQNWLDLDNVQILRGPQGTLFGKNTSAGAFLLSSAAPSQDAFSGNYEVSLGNYDSRTIRSAVNVPVHDELALRFAGLWADEAGYVEDPRGGSYNGHEGYAFKAQALWTPTSTARFRLIADFARNDDNCCYGTVDAINGPTQPVVDALARAAGNPVVSGDPDAYQAVLNNDTNAELRDRGVVLISEFDLAGGQLVSTSAYRRWNQEQLAADAEFTGADLATLDVFFSSRQLSQELVYNSKLTDRADYLFGVYYSDEDIEAPRNFFWGTQAQAFWDTLLGANGIPRGFAQAPAGLFESEYMAGSSRSYAAFTHWIVKLTDPLSAIAGARYTHDEKQGEFRYSAFTTLPRPVLTVLGVAPGPAYDTSKNSDAVSGTLGLSYSFSTDATGYLTYSRGFKAGGVNLDSSAAGVVANNPAFGGVPLDPTYEPEFINGYEAGLKTQYLDGRARTNVAVFYDDISNLQVAQVLGLRLVVVSSPEAKLYGAEIENELALTDRLDLQLAGIFLPKAHFGDDPQLGVIANRRFVTAPRFSANTAIQFEQPLASPGLILTSRAAMRYEGREYTNTASNEQQGSKSLFDLSLGVKSPSDSWNLVAYCQNCTDKRYFTQTFTTPLQTGDINAFVGPPRTYGLALRGKF